MLLHPQPKNSKSQIGRVVRDLRQERAWTQAELARELGLSQSRLSEIEHGAGSFTAEQFLSILRLFNVSLSRFTGTSDRRDLQLQNAVARLGARHLQETTAVFPADEHEDVALVIREVLAQGSPRLTTALAPILVLNVDRVALGKLYLDLAKIGLEHRLGWLVENTLDSLWRSLANKSQDEGQSRSWSQQARRAGAVLGRFLESITKDRASTRGSLVTLDIFDVNLRSKKSIDDTQKASSEISQKWGLVTAIKPQDFVEALEAAHVADR